MHATAGEMRRLAIGLQGSGCLGPALRRVTAPFRTQRRPAAVAGVLGFSGALIGAETLSSEATAKPPVMLVHGTADPVVPFQAMATAEHGLSAAGIPVEGHARPGLAHGIDDGGLRLGVAFLKRVLGV